MRVERQIVVVNPNGLHARPAMQLVECATGFESDLSLTNPSDADGEPVTADAKSVMQVITLGATAGTTLSLVADGPDAEPAADAVEKLFADGFGE